MLDEERIGHLLVQKGRLSRRKFDEVMKLRKETGKSMLPILVERGILTPAQVEDIVGTVTSKVLFCATCRQRTYAPVFQENKRRCPWCMQVLELQGELTDEQSPDFESIAELTKEELPAEVRLVRGSAGRRFGKYILLSELGKGGTGTVQKAWDLVLGEYVALKFLRESDKTTSESENAFLRQERVLALLQEARVAVRLQHEHIVPIRDIGLVGAQVYLGMDYVQGSTMTDHVKKAHSRGRLSPLYESPLHYLLMMCDVSDAIHYANTFSRPLVHCDLKPGNIMISDAGSAYVLDFGLARLLDLPASEEVAIRGTPGFMAPEQASGSEREIGVWTDVYGLGAILYDLTAGRPPFRGTTFLEIALQTQHDRPVSPSAIVEQSSEMKRPEGARSLAIARLIEPVIMKCLEKKPADRYATALEVEEELGAIVEQVEGDEGGGQ